MDLFCAVPRMPKGLALQECFLFFVCVCVFLINSYFITVDLKKYCEDSMESSHVYHIHFLLLLIFYVSMTHVIISGATLVIIIN